MLNIKLIAIDTSIFGGVAADYFGYEKVRKKNAESFLTSITYQGLVPFFCWHHLEEILQHDDDTTVQNRFALIKKIPLVAWLKSVNHDGWVGHIVDIQGAEIKYLLDDPKIGYEKLISNVKKDLVYYSSGKEFTERFEDPLLLLRDYNFFKTQKKKAISSISHVHNSEIDNTKLSVLHESRLKRPREVKESLNNLRRKLEEDIQKRGDKKLNNADKYIRQFVSEVAQDGMKLYEMDSSSLYERFVESHGVDLDEIDENLTIGDLGYIATNKKRLRIIAESFGLDPQKISKIPHDAIPSLVILNELDKLIRMEKYASGSNITDKYLAVLSFYVDIIVVDKRLKEYFKQVIRRHQNLSLVINNIVSLSSYEKLENELNRLI